MASQLITAPKILFLDEPTSGLDSVASYKVVAYLKSFAKKNRVSAPNSPFDCLEHTNKFRSL